MPSFVPGNSACTACASTCVAECRITARPSGLCAGTGVNSVVSSGTKERSLRLPLLSRTHTMALSPLFGNSRSLIAAPTAVPAGTENDGKLLLFTDTLFTELPCSFLCSGECGIPGHLRNGCTVDVPQSRNANCMCTSYPEAEATL